MERDPILLAEIRAAVSEGVHRVLKPAEPTDDPNETIGDIRDLVAAGVYDALIDCGLLCQHQQSTPGMIRREYENDFPPPEYHPVNVNPKLLARFADDDRLYLAEAHGEHPAQHHILDVHAPVRDEPNPTIKMVCQRGWVRTRVQLVHGPLGPLGLKVCGRCVDVAKVFPDHPLRRPEPDDAPITLPTEVIHHQMPDKGVLWLLRGQNDRVLHVKNDVDYKSSGPIYPFDCGMAIAPDDRRVMAALSYDLLPERGERVQVCRRCAERHFL